MLMLFGVGAQLYAEGQEAPAGTVSGSKQQTDSTGIVITQPQETAKARPKRDRMLTEEEAYDLVWNLPEISKEIERILERGGIPFSTVAARPDSAGQPDGDKPFYAIRFQALHAKDVLVDLLFSVDAFTGQITVYDSPTGSFISLEDWRRQRK
jgi:hypothetical protein